jgi:hypothetical protein
MNESQVNPPGGQWRRKLLVHSATQIPLALHEHRLRGAVKIEQGVITQVDVAGKDNEPCEPVSFLNYVTLATGAVEQIGPYRMVCHLNTDREAFAANPEGREGAGAMPLFSGGTVGKQVIALQVTTQESLDATHENRDDLGNRYVWLSMKDRAAYRRVDDWLNEFMALDFETAGIIAEAPDRSSLAKFERSYRHLLDITHPDDPTAPLAFRLLCEAWMGSQYLTKSDLSGYSICAPASLDDWLEPFRRGENQPATVDAVVAMIGDDATKGKARRVLEASETDRFEAVRDFLGWKSATSESKGGAE